MIFNKYEDKQGPFYKSGLIARFALTLDNYCDSDIGSRFISDEYIKGVCEQRDLISKKHKNLLTLIFAQTLLLAFIGNVNSISISGISITPPALSKLVLSISISSGLIGWVSVFIDQMIMDRLLNTIGNKIGFRQFDLVYLNYSTHNISASALIPKYFGLKSDGGQKLLFGVLCMLFFAIIAFAFITPAIVVIHTLVGSIQASKSLVVYSLSAVSGLLLFTSVMLAITFMIKYKFRPSEIPEPDFAFPNDNLLDLGNPIAFMKQDQKNSEDT